jgi:hypothetical protein
MPGPTERTWSQVGAEYTTPRYRPAIEAEIDRLDWEQVSDDGVISGPMSPVMTIAEVIRQLELPNVTAVARGSTPLHYPDGSETASYQLLGVQCRYRNGVLRLYVLDIGVGAVPLAQDFTPIERARGLEPPSLDAP